MNVEVVGMIYQSTRYLAFMVDQFQKHVSPVPWRIVACDPTRGVVSALKGMGVPHEIYRSKNPRAHYLTRVYACTNWYIENSTRDYVVEVNSDMAFSPGWLDALLSHASSDTYPVSQLVQPVTCGHAHLLGGDFGTPGDFREQEWLAFAKKFKKPTVKDGGLYMPRATERKWFLELGGFPLVPSDPAVPSDAQFFAECGKRHVTVRDSMVYHVWEGEMRDK